MASAPQEFQNLEALLESTLNITEETKDEVTNNVLAFCADPTSIFQFMQLLLVSTSTVISQAATIYLKQSLELHKQQFPMQYLAEIQDLSLRIIQEVKNNLVLTTFSPCISIIYQLSEQNWPELFSVLTENLSSPTTLNIISNMLLQMSQAAISDNLEFLINIVNHSLNSDNVSMAVEACNLLATLETVYDDQAQPYKDFITSTLTLNQIVNLSNKIVNSNQTDYTNYWKAISQFNIQKVFPDDQLFILATNAINIASSNDLELTQKVPPIESLLPALPSLIDYLEEILTLSLTLCANAIEEDQTLQIPHLAPFEMAVHVFNGREIYAILMEILTKAFDTQVSELQTAALLVFRTILTDLPQIAFSSFEDIVDLIDRALQSDYALLQQAACSVMTVFDQSFQSVNTHSPILLASLLPLLTSEVTETRVEAMHAAMSLLPGIDSSIPDFFKTIFALREKVTDDDWFPYTAILAYSIDLDEEFTDDDTDSLLQFISEESQKGEDRMVGILGVIIALLHHDDTQAEIILDELKEKLIALFSSGNKTVKFEAVTFAGHLSTTLGGRVTEYLKDFIWPIMEILTSSKGKLLAVSIESLSIISKENPELVDQAEFVKYVIDGLQDDNDVVQTAALKALRILRRKLTADQQMNSLPILVKTIENSLDADLVNDSLLTLSKLLKHSLPDNQATYIEESIKVVNHMADNTLAIQAGKNLTECGSFRTLSMSIEHFFSSLLLFPTPLGDTIINFLFNWLDEDFDVTGAFGNAMKYNTVSVETQHKILEKTIILLKSAKDPSMQQNIVYFIKVTLESHSEFSESVVDLLPYIEKWRSEGKEKQYGFKEVLANISSLYLELAKNPDFPEDLVKLSMAEFPPLDYMETEPMIKNIVFLTKSGRFEREAALAIARYIVWDLVSKSKAKIQEEVEQSMFDEFRRIASERRDVMSEIEQIYKKQRSRLRKILGALN